MNKELRHDHFMAKVPQVLGEKAAPKFLGTDIYTDKQEKQNMNMPISTQFAEKQKTMTSREIAELTGKEHKNVLADIRKMLVEIQSAEKPADYKDGRGRTQPCLC